MALTRRRFAAFALAAPGAFDRTFMRKVQRVDIFPSRTRAQPSHFRRRNFLSRTARGTKIGCARSGGLELVDRAAGPFDPRRLRRPAMRTP